jgi:septal ring factor EnvC (AmiA/AmiB activator)
MKDYAYSIAAGLAFIAGLWLASAHYDRKIALMEAAQSEALRAAERKNAEGLSKATNTINLAQAEYNDLRAELDRARARMRHSDGNRASSGDSADALRKRVARLEGLVQRLADSGSECGRLYQRCAKNHDALTEILK